MERPAGATLSARTCLTSSRRSLSEGMLTSYCQVVKYLLNAYATDDIIAEVEADIISYNREGSATASITCSYRGQRPYVVVLYITNTN